MLYGETTLKERSRKVRNEKNERNVFDDLGFPREKAVALAMKAALHRKIVQYAKHYTGRVRSFF
jgi:hypothetical protein